MVRQNNEYMLIKILGILNNFTMFFFFLNLRKKSAVSPIKFCCIIPYTLRLIVVTQTQRRYGTVCFPVVQLKHLFI